MTRRLERVLLPAGPPTLEMILKLAEKLTGRPATPEERAEVEQELEAALAPLSPTTARSE